MKQYFYPAIFHTAEEGGFWVSFPDLPECLTEGDTMADAYEMAIEALGLSLTDRIHNHEKLPVPSTPDQIALDTSDSHLVVIQFDMEAYQKKHNSKAVKKTLSIPEWLNEEAVTLGINFSQVLQEALIAKIQSHYCQLPAIVQAALFFLSLVYASPITLTLSYPPPALLSS